MRTHDTFKSYAIMLVVRMRVFVHDVLTPNSLPVLTGVHSLAAGASAALRIPATSPLL